MKTPFVFLTILLVAALLMGCGTISLNPTAKNITPSDNIITETRPVSGFTGVDMRTIGTVTITQGGTEALIVKGSDNLLPLVKTSVQNGILVIEMENINIQSLKKGNVLTFEITVKDLNSLNVSGLGTVEMSGLETKSLNLAMSGAGAIKIDKLAADSVSVNVSGMGGITLAGTANHADVSIFGAGEISAADLECKTANASISGVGTATVWVADELTGNISGAGGVRYYGEPKTKTNSTGVGRFEALGKK
jgi:hypothetical protein